MEAKRKKADEFWDSILNGEKRISDKEAEEMHTLTKKLKKEWGFRR